MTKPITPEMSAAWRTLQAWALAVRGEASASEADRQAAEAIDLLDNANYMVPIEEAEEEAEEEHARLMAGLRGIDLNDRYPTRPDPAEWADTTREDMDRHQQAQDDAVIAAGGEVHMATIPLSELTGEGLSRALRKKQK